MKMTSVLAVVNHIFLEISGSHVLRCNAWYKRDCTDIDEELRWMDIDSGAEPWHGPFVKFGHSKFHIDRREDGCGTCVSMPHDTNSWIAYIH